MEIFSFFLYRDNLKFLTVKFLCYSLEFFSGMFYTFEVVTIVID